MTNKIIDFPSDVITEYKESTEPDPQYIESAKEFLSETEAGGVSHAIICYRTTNGDLNWRIFNFPHLTYILGMMERVKFDLQKDEDADS